MIQKKEYIKYRIERAKESIEEAKILAKNNHWTTTVSRLYYSVFYVANALLLTIDVGTKTHSGTRSKFHEHFIKTGKLDIKYGHLYSELFDLRHKGDYEVYQTFSKDDVEPYIDETELFIKSAETLLENEL